MSNFDASQPQEYYRGILREADSAAQARNGAKALELLAQLMVEDLPPPLQASYWSIKGEAHLCLQDYSLAIPCFETALWLYRQPEVDTASPLQIVQLRNSLAGAYYHSAQYLKALEQHQLCLKVVLGGIVVSSQFKLKLYTNMGNECCYLGRIKEALEYFEVALSLVVEGEDAIDRALAYWGAGCAYRQHGDYEIARQYLELALSLAEQAGANHFVLGLRNMLAWVLISLKEYAQASQLLQQGMAELAHYTGPQHTLLEAQYNLNLAYLYFEQNDLSQALQAIIHTKALAVIANDYETMGQVLMQQVEIQLAMQGSYEEAQQGFAESLTYLGKLDSKRISLQAHKRYAEALKRAGYFDQAFEMLTTAYKLLDESY